MRTALAHLELSKFLVPPEPGDELGVLLLTTFGLDLAVLGALLASTSPEELSAGENDGSAAPGVGDVLAFTPFSARAGSGDAELLVLADAGGIQSSLAKGADGLARYLSRFVVPVRAPATGRFRSFFHPKLAVAGFRSAANANALRWRVLIGSKNLTRGAAFELGIWLDSGKQRHNAPGVRGQAVLDAIDAWRVQATSKVNQRRYTDFIRRLTGAGLGKAYFPVGGQAQRLVRRIQVQSTFDVPDKPREALVVTPFLNARTLPRMNGKARGIVISNTFTAADCALVEERGWAPRRWRGGTWAHSVLESKRFPSSLHAKLALCRAGEGWQLYIGSGNATAGGKARNRELGLVLDLEAKLAKRLHDELTREAEPFLAELSDVENDDERERLARGLADATSSVAVERGDSKLTLTLPPGSDLVEALAAGATLSVMLSATEVQVAWDPRLNEVLEIPLVDNRPGLISITLAGNGTADMVTALLPYEGTERNIEALRAATLPEAVTRAWDEARWKERILAVRGVTPVTHMRRKIPRGRGRSSEPRRWVRRVTVEDLVRIATLAPDRARGLLDPGRIRQVVFDGQAPPDGLVEAIRVLTEAP